MGAQRKFSTMAVDAYSVPSSFKIDNDTHCFVRATDGSYEWTNAGGGWSSHRQHTKVASNELYKEWILDFMPTDTLSKSGIIFGENGVCHTYANVELLVGKHNASVSAAEGDDVAICVYGKYGLGKEERKELLKAAYNRVCSDNTISDPDALSTVLNRLEDTTLDELLAWKSAAEKYCSIPVSQILAKAPDAGRQIATERMNALIKEKELIYTQNKGNYVAISSKLREAIIKHSTDYLAFLRGINYITNPEYETYCTNINNFLNSLRATIELQMQELNNNGIVTTSLVRGLM